MHSNTRSSDAPGNQLRPAASRNDRLRQAIFAAIAIGAAGGFAQVSWAQSPCDVSDSTFNDGGWGVTTFTTGNGGTSTGSQSTVGNPTPGRFVQNHLNGGLGTVQAIHKRQGTAGRVDPAGVPITAFTFSIDAMWSGGLGGNGQQVGLACEQDGIEYRAGGLTTGSSGNWVTRRETLYPSDFVRFDGAAGSPDFSPSGSPINFGFRTGNANQAANGAVNINVVYDNFSVTVHRSGVADTTFANADWNITNFTTGNGGAATGSQSAVGNPTPGRVVQNHLNGGAGTLQAFHRYLACDAVIDPSVIPVAWIDFSINAKWTGGLGGNGQQIGLACEQNGIAYRAGGTVTGSSGNWVTINQTLVTPADFVRMDGLAGSLDVSPSGSPIRFGFRTGNANSGANGAVNIEVTYDNFSVTLYCRADFDGDGFVSGADFDQFVLAFESGDMSADFDGDGFITGLDFDKYVQAFEAGC